MGLGFLAVSLAGYFVSAGQIRHGITSQHLPLTGDNIYSELQKDLFRPIFISSFMASDTFLRDWTIAGEHNPTQITRFLHEIKARYGTVTSFFISERTRTYYHADGILKRVDPDEPRDMWYFRVREMQEPYEINVDPDLANRDTMTIFINYRVFDYEGGFLGATGVGLTVDTVRHLIESYEKRFSRRIFFVDAQGRITLASPAMDSRKEGIRDLPGLAEVADEILMRGPRPYSLQYTLDGSVVQVNARFIPEFGWHLVVEQTEDPSLLPLRRVLWGSLAMSLLITLVVLAMVRYTVGFFQARLEKMATTDKLTGLLNRGAMEIIFAHIARDLLRTPRPLSAMMMDIDHFKAVNDRYGHLAGDEVLRRTVDLARHGLRTSDALGRWGGEEFLALLRDCTLEDAVTVAEKIRREVAAALFLPGEGGLTLTVSMGVAQMAPGETLDSLLARLDAALYRAKEGGRNRVDRAL